MVEFAHSIGVPVAKMRSIPRLRRRRHRKQRRTSRRGTRQDATLAAHTRTSVQLLGMSHESSADDIRAGAGSSRRTRTQRIRVHSLSRLDQAQVAQTTGSAAAGGGGIRRRSGLVIDIRRAGAHHGRNVIRMAGTCRRATADTMAADELRAPSRDGETGHRVELEAGTIEPGKRADLVIVAAIARGHCEAAG